MRRVITVSPVHEGWQVLDGLAEPAPFGSGRQAEQHARALAESLARDGAPVEVEIYLRDGALAARLRYGAPIELEPA